MAITADEASDGLTRLIEQATRDQEAIEIACESGSAFLVPKALWNSMIETAYLLRSSVNARRLTAGIAHVVAGEVRMHNTKFDLDDPTDVTLNAVQEFRERELPRFSSVDDLMTDLQAAKLPEEDDD